VLLRELLQRSGIMDACTKAGATLPMAGDLKAGYRRRMS
jgi:hypothetical protein